MLSEYYGDDRLQIALTRKDGSEILLGGVVWQEDVDDQLRLSGQKFNVNLARNMDPIMQSYCNYSSY